MARKGDYQIVNVGAPAEVNPDEKPFTVYRWDGNGWCYQHQYDATSESEVQEFVQAHGLVLVETGTLGMWPMRIYRVG